MRTYFHCAPLCYALISCTFKLVINVTDLISKKLSLFIPIYHFKLSISLTNFFFVTLFFIHFQKSGRLGSVLRNNL